MRFIPLSIESCRAALHRRQLPVDIRSGIWTFLGWREASAFRDRVLFVVLSRPPIKFESLQFLAKRPTGEVPNVNKRTQSRKVRSPRIRDMSLTPVMEKSKGGMRRRRSMMG